MTQELTSPGDSVVSGDGLGEMIARYDASSPDVAAAFVEMLERRRSDEALAGTSATIRSMATNNAVGPILRRQVAAMRKIQASFEPLTLFPIEATTVVPTGPALLPDFSGSNFRRLESAVLSLLPKTTEEVEEAEQVAVEAASDPENRKMLAGIADHLPDRAQIAKMAPLAGFLAVAAVLVEFLPSILDSDQIAVLGALIAVYAIIFPPKPQP